ncbi:hypothetical protein [Marinobacter salinus]|nr:hypothetical protein [Marinobacter salinus]
MDRPILFKDEMVRAILEGRKTQTRRVVKGIDHDLLDMMSEDLETEAPNSELLELIYGPSTDDDGKRVADQWLVRCTDCPEEGVLTIGQGHGKPGDHLWVRETFGYRDDGRLYFQADQTLGQLNVDRWKPSIHMPRSLSRITLEITDVRVERLQDISEEDAWNEGVQDWMGKETPWKGELAPVSVHAFAALWESINGSDSWDANPWVWVIEFRRVD